jgi:hypothetical protein
MAGVYSYSGAFIPGTLARAEQIAAEFGNVAAGFSILAVQGTDSGSANAYVVTTSGGKDGIYTDGMIVEFKAANSNTTNSTIAVDGGATVGLTSSGGQALAGGAVIGGTWYRAMYNSTYSAFTIIAPTSLVITSNTISSAAPTHLVGLTPAGGSSTACAPIDVTFAIDQSIVPTWTGAHTFANAVSFLSTVMFSGGLSLTGGSSQYAATLTGNSTAGHSLGLEVNAGVNNSDIALLVNSQNGGTQFFEINGVGSVTVGAPTGGAQGVGTINATGLFVNGAAVKTTSVSSANPSASVGLAAVNGTAATFMTSDSAPALSQAIAPTWTGAHTFTPSSAVTAATINAAVNAVGLSIVGGTNTSLQYLVTFATAQGSGFSSGLSLSAGTTSADTALLVQNAAASTVFAQIFGDGEFMFTTPTSASKQATGFYQVGMMDMPFHATQTPALSDRGKIIDAPGNVTIPANSSVAFPIGSSMLILNDTGGTITIAVTTDTLTWLPSGTAGTRTLAALGVATVTKRTATQWLIWGFGLT